MRARRLMGQLAIVGGVAVAVLAVCCGWPDYQLRTADADAGDAEVDTGPMEDAAPYDVPVAFCNDGGLRSGEAVLCACSGAPLDDAGDAEVGPIGHQTCTLEGGVGACVGCPPTTACDTVTAPPGMTCIPGGVSVLGATNMNVCPPFGCTVEQPEHSVALSRFFLDEREVSVKRFRDWWRNGHVTPKPGDVIFTAGDGTTITWQESWTPTEPVVRNDANAATWLGPDVTDNDALPINHVDWPTALAFCASTIAGGRLPTEAEWEAAASGREGRLFPFSAPDTRNDNPTAAMLPCSRALSAAGGSDCGPPAPPTSAPAGSRDGAWDLAGSLSEWVLDVPPPGALSCPGNCYPKTPSADPLLFVAEIAKRGVRGGAWSDTQPRVLRAQARDFRPLTEKTSAIGFRCAKR